mgnify:CR=1 FL=1
MGGKSNCMYVNSSQCPGVKHTARVHSVRNEDIEQLLFLKLEPQSQAVDYEVNQALTWER